MWIRRSQRAASGVSIRGDPIGLIKMQASAPLTPSADQAPGLFSTMMFLINSLSGFSSARFLSAVRHCSTNALSSTPISSLTASGPLRLSCKPFMESTRAQICARELVSRALDHKPATTYPATKQNASATTAPNLYTVGLHLVVGMPVFPVLTLSLTAKASALRGARRRHLAPSPLRRPPLPTDTESFDINLRPASADDVGDHPRAHSTLILASLMIFSYFAISSRM